MNEYPQGEPIREGLEARIAGLTVDYQTKVRSAILAESMLILRKKAASPEVLFAELNQLRQAVFSTGRLNHLDSIRQRIKTLNNINAGLIAIAIGDARLTSKEERALMIKVKNGHDNALNIAINEAVDILRREFKVPEVNLAKNLRAELDDFEQTREREELDRRLAGARARPGQKPINAKAEQRDLVSDKDFAEYMQRMGERLGIKIPESKKKSETQK